MERYLFVTNKNSELPCVGETLILELCIKVKGNSQPILISTGDNEQDKIPIDVIIDPGSFEIVDPSGGQLSDDSRRILVPTKEEDSRSVYFLLKANTPGEQYIHINLFQEVEIFGIDLPLNITERKNEDNDISPLPISLPLNYSINKTGTNLVLLVKKLETPSQYNYSVEVIYPTKDNDKALVVGNFEFMMEPRAYFDDLIGELEFYKEEPKKIETKGFNLYTDIFDHLKPLKEIYERDIDRIQSIKIYSEERWIPWEIVKPWAKKSENPVLCKRNIPFLCEAHSFSRGYLKSNKDEQPRYSIKNIDVFRHEPLYSGNRFFEKMLVVIPTDITDLPNLIKERDWILQFGKKYGIDVKAIESIDDFRASLSTSDYDIIHISSHGELQSNNPRKSKIQLQNGQRFSLEEIIGPLTNFGSKEPMVILNACQSASASTTITVIEGWADRFLNAGCCIFLGALWKIDDLIAMRFTANLYTGIREYNYTIGEAVRNARKNCKTKCIKECSKDCGIHNDSSWLAYQLYGHPNSVLRLGKTMIQ